MKTITILLTVFSLASAVFGVEPNKPIISKDVQIKHLQEEMIKLQQELVKKDELLKEKDKEIADLKKILKKNGIDIDRNIRDINKREVILNRKYSKKYRVVERPFFGIKLGESLEEVKQRYKLELSKQGVKLQQIYNVEVDDDEIKYLQINIYRGLVVSIKVQFVDNSRECSNGLKLKLYRQYKDLRKVERKFYSKRRLNRAVSKLMNIGKTWKIKRQGTDVYISLGTVSDTTLYYTHYGLFKDYHNDIDLKLKEVDVDL